MDFVFSLLTTPKGWLWLAFWSAPQLVIGATLIRKRKLNSRLAALGVGAALAATCWMIMPLIDDHLYNLSDHVEKKLPLALTAFLPLAMVFMFTVHEQFIVTPAAPRREPSLRPHVGELFGWLSLSLIAWMVLFYYFEMDELGSETTVALSGVAHLIALCLLALSHHREAPAPARLAIALGLGWNVAAAAWGIYELSKWGDMPRPGWPTGMALLIWVFLRKWLAVRRVTRAWSGPSSGDGDA